MGVMSRRVLPLCGRMFVCCPGLRARSRQPVKRYKRMLTELFPRNQDDLNERKIGKLCDYAAQNPTRLPKIANTLEQRGYKELRLEKYGYVRIVMKSYSKLLSSCRDQMPLFAISVISMIRALLDNRRDDMRILACETFVDFVRNQTDGAYIHTLDGLLPQMCALARETGEEKRRRPLRAAGLRCLSEMVWFMGAHSHISPNFDEIVSAVLDNYEISPLGHHRERDDEALGTGSMDLGSGEAVYRVRSHAMEVMRREGKAAVATMKEAMVKLRHHKGGDHPSGPAHVGKAELENPGLWAHHAVQNMARLCKEATTTRRVVEPMLRYFDNGNHWPPPAVADPPHTLASEVLRDMQDVMDRAGHGQLLLAVVLRHLDNKNVVGKAKAQAGIVSQVALLARRSRTISGVADVTAMGTIARHLQKSLLVTWKLQEEAGGAGGDGPAPDTSAHALLQRAAEETLGELARRVGDSGPILDMMAAMLEKISGPAPMARSTLDAVTSVARSAADLPDDTHPDHQVFPEALFLQLVQVMVYPDAGTRILAHRILAILLPPLPQTRDKETPLRSRGALDWLLHKDKDKNKGGSEDHRDAKRGPEHSLASLSMRDHPLSDSTRVSSGAPSSTGTPMSAREGLKDAKWRREHNRSISDGNATRDGQDPSGLLPTSPLTRSIDRIRTGRLSYVLGNKRRNSSKESSGELFPVRLSAVQASLLLSGLWLQAHLPDNKPANFEAMAYTFNLVVLYSRPKTTNHSTLVRALQLAVSLRDEALEPADEENAPPAHARRSLFTLSTSMLITIARTFGFTQAIGPAKASMSRDLRDPFLDLDVDDHLHVAPEGPMLHTSSTGPVYGSTFDEVSATGALSKAKSIPAEETTAGILGTMLSSNSFLMELEGADAIDRARMPFQPDESFALRPKLLADPLPPPSPPAVFTPTSYDLDPLPTKGGVGDEELVRSRSEAELLGSAVEDAAGHAPSVDDLLQELEMLEMSPQSPTALASPSAASAPASALYARSEPATFYPNGSGTPGVPTSAMTPFSVDNNPFANHGFGSTHAPPRQPDWAELLGGLPHPAPIATRLPLQPVSKNSNTPPMSPSSADYRTIPREPWEFLKLPPSSTYDGFLKAAAL